MTFTSSSVTSTAAGDLAAPQDSASADEVGAGVVVLIAILVLIVVLGLVVLVAWKKKNSTERKVAPAPEDLATPATSPPLPSLRAPAAAHVAGTDGFIDI